MRLVVSGPLAITKLLISSVFSKYRILNFNAVLPSICLSVYWFVCLSVCSLLFAVHSHTLSVVCFCVFVCFIWAVLPEINVSYRNDYDGWFYGHIKTSEQRIVIS